MMSAPSWMIVPSGVSMHGMIQRPTVGTISLRYRSLPGDLSTNAMPWVRRYDRALPVYNDAGAPYSV